MSKTHYIEIFEYHPKLKLDLLACQPSPTRHPTFLCYSIKENGEHVRIPNFNNIVVRLTFLKLLYG